MKRKFANLNQRKKINPKTPTAQSLTHHLTTPWTSQTQSHNILENEIGHTHTRLSHLHFTLHNTQTT